jgi:hypothetical protein
MSDSDSSDSSAQDDESLQFDIEPNLLEDEDAFQADLMVTDDISASDLTRLTSLSEDEIELELGNQLFGDDSASFSHSFLDEGEDTYWVYFLKLTVS